MNSVWTEKSSFDVRFEIKNKIIHEQSELESRITHESDQSLGNQKSLFIVHQSE